MISIQFFFFNIVEILTTQKEVFGTHMLDGWFGLVMRGRISTYVLWSFSCFI
jgi:hypothetical protein